MTGRYTRATHVAVGHSPESPREIIISFIYKRMDTDRSFCLAFRERKFSIDRILQLNTRPINMQLLKPYYESFDVIRKKFTPNIKLIRPTTGIRMSALTLEEIRQAVNNAGAGTFVVQQITWEGIAQFLAAVAEVFGETLRFWQGQTTEQNLLYVVQCAEDFFNRHFMCCYGVLTTLNEWVIQEGGYEGVIPLARRITRAARQFNYEPKAMPGFVYCDDATTETKNYMIKCSNCQHPWEVIVRYNPRRKICNHCLKCMCLVPTCGLTFNSTEMCNRHYEIAHQHYKTLTDTKPKHT